MISPLQHGQLPSQQALTWESVPLQSKLFNSLGGIRHGLTRRVREEPRAEANISYTAPRDTHAAWEMRQFWCSSMGIDASTLVVPRQVHGNAVVRAVAADAGCGAAPGSKLIADADSIITNDDGVALMTTHADCLPILMYAPSSRAIAAVHAGWRSTVGNVTGNTVNAMHAAFGAKPADIHVFLGPAICTECYEVGADVADAWRLLDRDGASGAIRDEDGRTTFDLVSANRALLQQAGVPVNQVDLANTCTRCNDGEWFSHRGQGPLTGRFGAVIALGDSSR